MKEKITNELPLAETVGFIKLSQYQYTLGKVFRVI